MSGEFLGIHNIDVTVFVSFLWGATTCKNMTCHNNLFKYVLNKILRL